MRVLALSLLAIASAASAQMDPSNPGGAPLAPNKGPLNQPEQGRVIRDAAPGTDLQSQDRDQPRAPSVLNGVEEAQRTGTTRAAKGEPPSNSRNQAPVETGPTPPKR